MHVHHRDGARARCGYAAARVEEAFLQGPEQRPPAPEVAEPGQVRGALRELQGNLHARGVDEVHPRGRREGRTLLVVVLGVIFEDAGVVFVVIPLVLLLLLLIIIDGGGCTGDRDK